MPLSPHSIFTLTRSQVSAIKDPEHGGEEDAAADDELEKNPKLLPRPISSLKHLGLLGFQVGAIEQIDATSFRVWRKAIVLGNYECFLDVRLTRDNNITTRKIYQLQFVLYQLLFHLMKQQKQKALSFLLKQEHNGKVQKEFYSKLVKGDINGKDKEVYSIKLPGNPKLGEGKPENQNHAIVFTRRNVVQTIDMNQDNYFEEALKMRNLLEEFHENHGIRLATILGVREHVFKGSILHVKSRNEFCNSWATCSCKSSKGRMHYGHPDVFDRVFHITRGGISKASRVINISEDIYAAGGNGEQVLSREIYRLGQLFDFFRMLSFYFTTVGFYLCTMLTVITMYIFLYGKTYLCSMGTVDKGNENCDDSQNPIDIEKGVNLDKELANMNSGFYTFCAHGTLYHNIDQLISRDGKSRYLQLYFYDGEAEISQRSSWKNVDRRIIQKLTRILASNPYVRTFKQLSDLGPLDNYRVTLNASVELDQRVYNKPTTSEV
ncbi:unnamed protein product [Lactuca saligna]|uniref:Glycosyl transferase 48 domain-containing protein n=1 Tax=Lactuca saligna TaxID=75948 RepID=A0AA35V4P3_LACSI|nr:unnamed protein product [Lactuca saligna]